MISVPVLRRPGPHQGDTKTFTDIRITRSNLFLINIQLCLSHFNCEKTSFYGHTLFRTSSPVKDVVLRPVKSGLFSKRLRKRLCAKRFRCSSLLDCAPFYYRSSRFSIVPLPLSSNSYPKASSILI